MQIDRVIGLISSHLPKFLVVLTENLKPSTLSTTDQGIERIDAGPFSFIRIRTIESKHLTTNLFNPLSCCTYSSIFNQMIGVKAIRCFLFK